MINRILIRIKVVQLLYSYLLTRSEFKIETSPETNSRDKRTAYNVYLDLLMLVLELSGYNVQRGDRPLPVPEALKNKYLHDSRLARSLSSDDQIRSIILRDPERMAAFDSVAPALYNALITSSAYRSYIRTRDRDIADDSRFWTSVIETVIAANQDFVAVCRQRDAFTLRGFDEGVRMAVYTLSNFTDSRMRFTAARNSLDESLAKAYELYHALLLLVCELTRTQDLRLDAARNKYLPSAEDLNPNTRFVDNAFAAAIAANPQMEEYLKDHPVSWVENDTLVKTLLDRIIESDTYREYMEAPETDFAADCEFWRTVFRTIILPSDELAEALEEKSIYWNDDVQIMGTFVLKTIKQFAVNGPETQLLPQYKDEEDAALGADLFVAAVGNYDLYRSYIDRFLKSSSWDSDRLAFMDVVIMVAAIAEILKYPQIPIAVSMNEYIEIANSYSTPRSGQFINGILFAVVNYLKSEHLLDKN